MYLALIEAVSYQRSRPSRTAPVSHGEIRSIAHLDATKASRIMFAPLQNARWLAARRAAQRGRASDLAHGDALARAGPVERGSRLGGRCGGLPAAGVDRRALARRCMTSFACGHVRTRAAVRAARIPASEDGEKEEETKIDRPPMCGCLASVRVVRGFGNIFYRVERHEHYRVERHEHEPRQPRQN